jgi:hypothetical protein
MWQADTNCIHASGRSAMPARAALNVADLDV